jgi:hypothetical protein
VFLGAGLDVAAGDSDRRRAEEAQPPGRLFVGHVDESQFGIDLEFEADPLH